MGRTGNTFWPDNTRDTLYLTEIDLDSAAEQATEKWPGIRSDEIRICAEHIHTNAIGYDLYVSSDYTDFVVVKAKPAYFERIAAKDIAPAQAGEGDDTPLVHGGIAPPL